MAWYWAPCPRKDRFTPKERAQRKQAMNREWQKVYCLVLCDENTFDFDTLPKVLLSGVDVRGPGSVSCINRI